MLTNISILGGVPLHVARHAFVRLRSFYTYRPLMGRVSQVCLCRLAALAGAGIQYGLPPHASLYERPW